MNDETHGKDSSDREDTPDSTAHKLPSLLNNKDIVSGMVGAVLASLIIAIVGIISTSMNKIIDEEKIRYLAYKISGEKQFFTILGQNLKEETNLFPKFSTISATVVANSNTDGRVTYGSPVSCPDESRILSVSLVRANTITSASWHYCACERNNNQLIASVTTTSDNQNGACVCEALCIAE